MAIYDFDRVIDRRDTNSLKWDFAVERGLPEDVLPLWVADMDFRAPRAVLEALNRAVDHGIFGYSDVKEGYFKAVSNWFEKHYGWKTEPEWLVKTPGVVFALAAAVRAFTEPGDAVLIQPPVYYPFFSVIWENGREVAENPLVYEGGKYYMDLVDFEKKIVECHVKLFFLCSPHNPVGRVWTKEELQAMGDICRRHGVLVVSDEIHCDFAFPEHPHTMFPLAVPTLEDNCIVCTAPSKSFNLAGLQVSNIWVKNPEIRARFSREIEGSGYGSLNCLGPVACQAAYESGEEWLEECKKYMRGNLDYLRDFLTQQIPQIKLVEPEGTYFAWLDCTELGLQGYKDLENLVVEKAKLWLDSGHIFGGGAEQFERVVLACPKVTLSQALGRLSRAVQALVLK
jgi:cystathionine beta-lyase